MGPSLVDDSLEKTGMIVYQLPGLLSSLFSLPPQYYVKSDGNFDCANDTKIMVMHRLLTGMGRSCHYDFVFRCVLGFYLE